MVMEDEKGPDSKVVLSLPGGNGQPLHELTPARSGASADYFMRYKQHEPGKFSKVPGWGSIAEGLAHVTRTHAFFVQCPRRTDLACQVGP